MDGLQQTGFTTAVGAGNEIDARGGKQGHRMQITHRGDRKTSEGHARSEAHGHDDVEAFVGLGFLN